MGFDVTTKLIRPEQGVTYIFVVNSNDEEPIVSKTPSRTLTSAFYNLNQTKRHFLKVNWFIDLFLSGKFDAKSLETSADIFGEAEMVKLNMIKKGGHK
jgi:hypothetical protein